MKISKNSWHYRFVKWMDIWPSNSLCIYFWQIAGAFLHCAMIGTSIGMVGVLFSYAGWQFIIDVSAEMAFMLVVLNIVVYGTALVYFLHTWVQEYLDYREMKSWGKPSKEPSLLTSYVKAKKDKICPVLEFVDD